MTLISRTFGAQPLDLRLVVPWLQLALLAMVIENIGSIEAIARFVGARLSSSDGTSP